MKKLIITAFLLLGTYAFAGQSDDVYWTLFETIAEAEAECPTHLGDSITAEYGWDGEIRGYRCIYSGYDGN